MIDTIILTLTQGSFTIINPDAFTPSAGWALNNQTYALRDIISKQNPTKKELALGVYKPRLTLFPYYAPSFAKSYGGHCTASKGTQHPITPLSITKTFLKIENSLQPDTVNFNYLFSFHFLLENSYSLFCFLVNLN